MEHSAFVPSPIWVAPFASLLLGIAVIPLAAPAFWESNLRKLGVSLLLGIPVLFLYSTRAPEALADTARDYTSFMVLLGSLFVISGGVLMDGDLEARPVVNTAFLGLGALVASFVGTTGASMLLVRPLLHTNSERTRVVHTVVFFIFLVSNIGGCLTPLGDPPLFLGYLQGVPFTWTFRLAVPWLTTCGLLLLVYFIWDTRAFAAEPPRALREDEAMTKPLRVLGTHNLALLGGIVGAAAFLSAPWREAAMIGFSCVSWLTTSHHIRHGNHFSLHPIVEVAVVFAGIFLTMVPALDLLRARGAELGIRHAWQYFWATGALSSFLDNAPTYLTFLALGQGQNLAAEVAGVPHRLLEAISLGAVFMGANSYIGNGPNFMVRSIAESRGVKMPSFGGYMLYSAAILIPVFVVVTFLFFVP
jgi:Na+/H+ antiporter NhaD/arsenite permease-like protein